MDSVLECMTVLVQRLLKLFLGHCRFIRWPLGDQRPKKHGQPSIGLSAGGNAVPKALVFPVSLLASSDDRAISEHKRDAALPLPLPPVGVRWKLSLGHGSQQRLQISQKSVPLLG
jgi:hypothetical protein